MSIEVDGTTAECWLHINVVLNRVRSNRHITLLFYSQNNCRFIYVNYYFILSSCQNSEVVTCLFNGEFREIADKSAKSNNKMEKKRKKQTKASRIRS